MKNFLEAIDKIGSAKSELTLVTSEGMIKFKQVESEISDCYHILELLPLNGGQRSKVTAKLIKLLKQRRDLKPIMEYYSDTLNGASVNSKKYNSSTTVLERHQQSINRYTNEAKRAYQKLFN